MGRPRKHEKVWAQGRIPNKKGKRQVYFNANASIATTSFKWAKEEAVDISSNIITCSGIQYMCQTWVEEEVQEEGEEEDEEVEEEEGEEEEVEEEILSSREL